MREIDQLSWFDNENYQILNNLEETKLGYELRRRATIFNGIFNLKEEYGEDWSVAAEFVVSRFKGEISSILEGKPSFCETVNFLPRKTLREISDLNDKNNISSLVDYQLTRTFNPIEKRDGIKLRQGFEIYEDLENMNKLREKLSKSAMDEGLLSDFMLFHSLGEVPITADGAAGEPGVSIPLSLNLVGYTNKELIQKFSKLLDDMRKLLEINEPLRDRKKSNVDAEKIVKYRIFQLLDLFIWRDLYQSDLKDAQLIDKALWGSRYDKTYYYDVIVKHIRKVTAWHYSLT